MSLFKLISTNHLQKKKKKKKKICNQMELLIEVSGFVSGFNLWLIMGVSDYNGKKMTI